MSNTVMAAFGITDADLLGSGWESTIYAFAATQILHNLDQLPADGFEFVCFPAKIHRASAGWTRAVAIIND